MRAIGNTYLLHLFENQYVFFFPGMSVENKTKLCCLITTL